MTERENFADLDYAGSRSDSVMGRFESGPIKERKLKWGTIKFNDKYHLTVITPETTVIFHRYGTPDGYYKLWERFRKEMKRADLSNKYDVYKYANRFDVTHYVKEVRLASRNDRKIKYKEENGN